jgi:hypothetical protein
MLISPFSCSVSFQKIFLVILHCAWLAFVIDIQSTRIDQSLFTLNFTICIAAFSSNCSFSWAFVLDAASAIYFFEHHLYTQLYHVLD